MPTVNIEKCKIDAYCKMIAILRKQTKLKKCTIVRRHSQLPSDWTFCYTWWRQIGLPLCRAADALWINFKFTLQIAGQKAINWAQIV